MLLIQGDNTQSFAIGSSDINASPINLAAGDSGTVAGIGSGGGTNSTLRGQLISQTYRPTTPVNPPPVNPPVVVGNRPVVVVALQEENSDNVESKNESLTPNLNVGTTCSSSSHNLLDNRDNPLTIDESLMTASGARSSADVPCNDESSDSTTDSLSMTETSDESNISQTGSSILGLLDLNR